MKKPTSGDGQRLYEYTEYRFDELEKSFKALLESFFEKKFSELEKKILEGKKEAPKPQAARTKSTTK